MSPPNHGPAFIRLIKLESAACSSSKKEAAFSGKGIAAVHGTGEDHVSFALKLRGGHAYLTLEVTEGANVIYSLNETELTGSSERIS